MTRFGSSPDRAAEGHLPSVTALIKAMEATLIKS